MKTTWKRMLVVLGVVGSVLALAGTAIAVGPQRMSEPFGAGRSAHGPGVMAGGVVMDAAAEYLGISESALATARHDGKSLAQIAIDHGKSVAGLQQALVTAFKADLDQAVAAGRLTDAQATQALATFQSHVQTLVSRTATGPMAGRGGGFGIGPGPGMCGGRR